LRHHGSPAKETPKREQLSEHTAAQGPSQVLGVLPLALLRVDGLLLRNLDETAEHLLCLSFSRDVPYAPCYEDQQIYIGKTVFFVTKASQESRRIEERNTRGANPFAFPQWIRFYSDLDLNEV